MTESNETIISLKHMQKAYGSHQVLKDISVDIKKGEIVKKVKEEELLETLRQELLHWNE